MTYEEIKNNEEINSYIRQADASLVALGFTEHSFAHVTLVAEKAGYILETLGYPARTVELAKIAGYLHEIGNLVNRIDHSQSGAVMAFRILDHMGFTPDEIGVIVSAIGIFGAWVVVVVLIGCDDGAFWSQMQGSVDVFHDSLNGMFKAVVFGIAVGLVALFQGYSARPTPDGVSRATTRTVVVSSLLVLGLDFIMTAFMFTVV